MSVIPILWSFFRSGPGAITLVVLSLFAAKVYGQWVGHAGRATEISVLRHANRSLIKNIRQNLAVNLRDQSRQANLTKALNESQATHEKARQDLHALTLAQDCNRCRFGRQRIRLLNRSIKKYSHR